MANFRNSASPMVPIRIDSPIVKATESSGATKEKFSFITRERSKTWISTFPRLSSSSERQERTVVRGDDKIYPRVTVNSI